ncbi:MAG: hypothetical protein JRC59_03175, partial [Deltaproteobacteria bacterium]|nr:hypothetical protein [Deltaproteobacteria bacterium]
METYLWIKSVLMAAAIIGGFGLFFISLKRLILIMQSVQGESEFELNRIPERIKLLFTDVLAQTNVRRKPGPG